MNSCQKEERYLSYFPKSQRIQYVNLTTSSLSSRLGKTQNKNPIHQVISVRNNKL